MVNNLESTGMSDLSFHLCLGATAAAAAKHHQKVLRYYAPAYLSNHHKLTDGFLEELMQQTLSDLDLGIEIDEHSNFTK